VPVSVSVTSETVPVPAGALVEAAASTSAPPPRGTTTPVPGTVASRSTRPSTTQTVALPGAVSGGTVAGSPSSFVAERRSAAYCAVLIGTAGPVAGSASRSAACTSVRSTTPSCATAYWCPVVYTCPTFTAGPAPDAAPRSGTATGARSGPAGTALTRSAATRVGCRALQPSAASAWSGVGIRYRVLWYTR